MSPVSIVLLVLTIPAVMGLIVITMALGNPRNYFTTSARIEAAVEVAIIVAFVLSLTGVHL